jgi:WD40 repeat protein
MSRDGRRLVTHETFYPETGSVISKCKVWDLAASARKPVTIEGARIAGFSLDGSRLLGTVTANGKRMTKIWDATTGVELLSLDDMDHRTVVFSLKGTLLAGIVVENSERTEEYGQVRTRGKLKVFDANNGQELSAFDVDYTTLGNGHTRRIIHFTPDEAQVAVFATNRGPTAPNARTMWSIVDARSGKLLRTFDDPETSLYVPSSQRTVEGFSDDGSQFLRVVHNVIHTTDCASGRPVHTLRGNVSAPADMVALPGGKLRTVEAGGTIREWNLRPVEPVLTAFVEEPGTMLFGERRSSPQCVVSADGAWVALFRQTTDANPVESVRVWDAAGKGSTKLTAPPRGSSQRYSQYHRTIRLSADGKRAALFRVDGKFPGGGARINRSAGIDPAGYTPDVTVWDVAGQKVLFHREQKQTEVGRLYWLAAFSPDGTMLALGERSTDEEKGNSKLTLLDIAADGAGKTIEVAGTIGFGSFSPDCKRFECGIGTPSGAYIMICDTATGNRVCTIEGDSLASLALGQDPITSHLLAKCWSPDGTRLAVAEPSTARIHLFDTATGKHVKMLDAPSRGGFIAPTDALAFSPDGRRLACVVRQGVGLVSTVSVLATDSGKELLSLPLSTSPSLSGEPLCFSPDGHRLLHFGPDITRSTRPGEAVMKFFVGVTTWDATPLPERKQP